MNPMMVPIRCACGHVLGCLLAECLWIKHRGREVIIPHGKIIHIKCERCRAYWFPEQPDGPSITEIVSVMEARWATFSKAKLREKGRVAVGLRFDVFMRDGFTCQYCGLSVDQGALLHADHVIPQSRGGPTTRENLITACIDCNLGKSNKDLTGVVASG
jgi:hypothetical protein